MHGVGPHPVRGANPNFDSYELMRLVTYVIATLAMRMLRLGCRVEERYIRHCSFACAKPV